ncbi:MAG: hypothetical protein IKC47_03955 [Clostridia bacterium]|nr:hypothetical protein [Clostridia bacterium]
MKNKLLCLLLATAMLLSMLLLAGCDIFNIPDDDDDQFPQIDNSVDLKEYAPTPSDDVYVEGETYYTSNAVHLVTEVNGNYTVNRPFTLDKDNVNKRIYSNVYLYEEDFVQVIYYKDFNDLGKLYVVLADQTDTQYVQIRNSTDGSPLQIDVVQQGVYNLILDITTFGIDFVKVDDIQTPVYEKVASCELSIHVSMDDHTYWPMTLDESTNEYFVERYIPCGASIGFGNQSRTSRYNLTVPFEMQNTIAYYDSVNKGSLQVHVGGTYKVYFNAKTYVVRLELQNPDTATYYYQVEWQQGNVLTPVGNQTPYLFEYQFVAQGKPTDPYVDIPSFFPMLGWKYSLTVVDPDGLTAYDAYIKESGTYKLTINLKDFTLTVARV